MLRSRSPLSTVRLFYTLLICGNATGTLHTLDIFKHKLPLPELVSIDERNTKKAFETIHETEVN